MQKSPDAFRTISEVAENLDLPQHVLRFWETRFPQVRPLKRAGGRRYYRPADVLLLRSIRQLLYDDGYTIKGVQRLLKEQGAKSLRGYEPAGTDTAGALAGLCGAIGADLDALPGPVDRGVADAFEFQAPGVIASRAVAEDELLVHEYAEADRGSAAGKALPERRTELLPDARADHLDALREALSIVEGCVDLLRAARHHRR